MARERKYVETGQRLQAFRKNTLKVTAQEFADALGLSVQAVNMMEQGWRDTSNATLKKINEVYDVPADTILTGTTYTGSRKPKASDRVTLEIKIAKLEARVEQLENILGHLVSTKKLQDA